MRAQESRFMPFFLSFTRARLGLTQRELAMRSGLSQSDISRLENTSKRLPLRVERAIKRMEIKDLASSYDKTELDGQKARQKRYELGLTQIALAKELGCSRSTISRIERYDGSVHSWYKDGLYDLEMSRLMLRYGMRRR